MLKEEKGMKFRQKLRTPFVAGFTGGIVIILFLVIISFGIFKGYNRQIVYSKVYVSTVSPKDTAACSTSLMLFKDKTLKKEYGTLSKSEVKICKEELLKQLQDERIILTPQEYTSNVVSYFNALLVILSVIIAAFSVISFVYLKNLTKDTVDEEIESDEYLKKVSRHVIGESRDAIEGAASKEDISSLLSKIEHLTDRINNIEKEGNSKGDEVVITKL